MSVRSTAALNGTASKASGVVAVKDGIREISPPRGALATTSSPTFLVSCSYLEIVSSSSTGVYWGCRDPVSCPSAARVRVAFTPSVGDSRDNVVEVTLQLSEVRSRPTVVDRQIGVLHATASGNLLLIHFHSQRAVSFGSVAKATVAPGYGRYEIQSLRCVVLTAGRWIDVLVATFASNCRDGNGEDQMACCQKLGFHGILMSRSCYQSTASVESEAYCDGVQ